MRLADYAQGRDNNFNLIRIAAAYAVLVSHSFPLAHGSSAVEPFTQMLGMSLGTMAVDVFFFTSGFLITASLMHRQNVKQFIWARILRIYPALVVVVLLSVFCMGVYFTTQPLTAYLSDAKIYIYVLRSSTLITGVSQHLPGVFEHNPFDCTVNGSLWTLPYELKMYITLTCAWLLVRFVPNGRGRVFKVVLVLSAVIAGLLLILVHLHVVNTGGKSLRLFYMFFTGASFYMLREKVVLSRPVFAFFLLLLLGSSLHKEIFYISYVLVIGYCILFCAYVPSGVIRNYNKLGDYSYGLYVYAFPVQQSIAALVPGIAPLGMLVLSSATTLIFAVLSWSLVEKHALALKEFQPRALHFPVLLFSSRGKS
ncbi:acyltransferase family protein [Desulfobulbus oligotrophicus]|nr:acyltransferase [Desulfobulbus oligotrophicus]